MITNFIPDEGDTYLVPDAENVYDLPSIERLIWGDDDVDISVFRHIGVYANSHEGQKLAELHLEIVTRLFPNAPITTSWIRQSPSENTLMFRKWLDDYAL